jgi:hypothetical protein
MVDTSVESSLPSPARLVQLLHGKIIAQAICVAAELKIADHLGETPETCEALAVKTETDAGALYRLMRLLSSVRIFAEGPDKTFAHTPDSLFLRADTPGSMQAIARMIGAPWHAEAETKMIDSVRHGAPAFKALHGMEVFEYFAKHDGPAQIFNEAMTGLSEALNRAIVEAYDFASARSIVDVGGGRGSLLCAILRAHAGLRGIIFDTPSAVRGAAAVIDAAGVSSRCDLEAGSFFEAVPPGASLYLLKFILHDWHDVDAKRILRTCRQAASRDSKLLIIEDLVGAPNVLSHAKLTDLEMMTIFGGRERGEAEYARLLEQSGFELKRVLPAHAPLFLLEAHPV